MTPSRAFEMLAVTQGPHAFCKLKATWQLLIQCLAPSAPDLMPSWGGGRHFRAEEDSGGKRKDHTGKLGLHVAPGHEGEGSRLSVTSKDFSEPQVC